jgi:hypothetical protein
MAADLLSGRLQNLTAHTDRSAPVLIVGTNCNEARVVPLPAAQGLRSHVPPRAKHLKAAQTLRRLAE